MGLMSKEYSSGSIKLLLSSPITEFQIILGKYLSMLAYGLILILIIVVYIVFGIFVIKDVDLPLLISGIFEIYLLFCLYSAIGLFFSCITSYQIVAAIGTLVTLIIFQKLGELFQAVNFVRDITFWLSTKTHSLLNGLLRSDNIIYYILLSSMFIVFSILKIRFLRQRISFIKKSIQYIGVFLITVSIGYITSRPQTVAYWDVTRFKQQTLTPKSQEILTHFNKDITLTSYVNFMGDEHLASKGYPANLNGEKQVFGRYIRFKPTLKMKYVYYYAHDLSGHHHISEPHDHEEFMQLTKKTAKINSINFNQSISDGEIPVEIDPEEKENSLFRTIESDSLPHAYLRMFHDLQVYPGEKEISTALTTMLNGAEKIGFVTGHGERSLDASGDKDYGGVPNTRSSRESLINNGFFPLSLELDNPIPNDVNIIVIADMKEPLDSTELSNFGEYIKRGGNLVINADINRNTQMGALLDLLGIKIVPGILAQRNQGYVPTSIFSYFTENSGMIDPIFSNYSKRNVPIVLSGASGLAKIEERGFNVVPVLQAKKGTWNEAGALNPDEIIEDSVKSTAANEIFNTAFALTRTNGEKEQRILIFGDADWLSKGELNISRAFFVGNNTLIVNMFKWMSYEKYPMAFDRPPLPDNELYFKFKDKKLSNFFFLFLFPFSWLVFGSIVWYKRRNK
jgi:ABC-2 type transport system permease protein